MASRRLKNKLAVVVATISLAIAVGWLSGGFMWLQVAIATARNEPSALIVDSAKYDFGTVPRGPTLQADFHVTNVGGRRLILNRESSDCSCLSSDPALLLAPGASHHLSATLQTHELRGPIQSRIRYRTNDPHQPILELTLIAQVSSEARK